MLFYVPNYLTLRAAIGIMKSVRAIIQVVGHSNIPVTPRDANDIRKWYLDVSV